MTTAINTKPLETTYPQQDVDSGQQTSTTTQGAESTALARNGGIGESPQDVRVNVPQAGSSLAAALPSLQTVAQPANYQNNLTSAKDKMVAGATATSPAAMAMLAVDNGSLQTKASAINEKLTIKDKEQILSRQTSSILDSAGESSKRGCKTQHKNTDENVGKIKQLGYSDREAKMLTRILQHKAAPESVKAKIAYELAAQGMTGAGQANTGALASNGLAMHKELASYANKEADKFSSIEKKIAPIPVVAVIQEAVQTTKSVNAMKSTADGLVSEVNTQAEFDGSPIQQGNNLDGAFTRKTFQGAATAL